MVTILVILHVLICVGLIIGILLQSGKGADLGAAFGGSSQTLFGSTGAVPFLNKLTAGAAIAFMITSLSLAFIASRAPRSSVIEGKAKTQQEAPIEAGKQTSIPSDAGTEKQ
ncbi:MAG: preprotein translocase subunit SecG [Proteobacteria bacterium]|nr:preprotein translocase subunit SecG [Pseudomonadota bacterium]